MNQRELSFFYRGVGFFILGGIAVTVLSSIDQHQHPWAYYVREIAVACLFIAGAAFIVFMTFRRQSNKPARTQPLPPSLYSDSWHKIARFAVVACVLLSVVTAAILLFVAPPKQCPNWYLPDRASTPLWGMFLLWTLPLLIVQVFMIVRWNWAVQKAIESADYPTTTPVTYILVMTVLGGCGMSQVPFVLLVSRCWLGP
jgi:hypothetical protein